MVNGTVGVVLVAVGVIAGLAAVAAGGLFMTNDSFATAQRACNPSVRTNPADEAAAAANCENDVVVDNNGDACQTANLGLYSASFTPECTYGTSYEINTLLEGQQDVDPLKLAPLFAAQNSFGSIGELLNAPEFTDCETFFDTSTGPLLGSGQWGTAVAGLNTVKTFTGVATAVKASFDQGFEAGIASLSSLLFENAHITLVEDVVNTILAGINNTFVMDGATTFDTTIPGTSEVNLIADLTQIAGLLPAAPAASLTNAITTIGACQGALSLPGTALTRDGVRQGLSLGTVDSPTGITGLPSGGPFVYFNSTILCTPIAGDCTVLAYLEFIEAALIASGSDNADAVSTVVSSMNSFAAAVGGVAAGFALANNDANPAGQALVNTDAFIAGIQGASFSLSQPLFQDPPYSGAVNPVVNPLTAQLSDINPAFASLCEGAGGPATCNTIQLFGSLATASNNLGDTDTGSQLNLLAGMALDCVGVGIVNWTQCLDSGVPSSAVLKPNLFWAANTEGLIGSFYDTSDFGVTGLLSDAEGFAAEMISQCKDAGLNGDAVALNQTTVPAGVACLAIGTIIMALNLVVRGEKVKVIGAVGGLIALIGAITALAGFLVLQGSPIYSSLTAEEPDVKPDNENAFATGVGLLYALALIGGGIVGALCFLVGTLCITPKGDPSTEILGKA